MRKQPLIALFYLAIIWGLCNCHEEIDRQTLVAQPEASQSVTERTAFSAEVKGMITDVDVTDKELITQHGHCWSTFPFPVLRDGDSLTTSYKGSRTTTGIFISYLSRLEPNKQYYVRAYAIINDNETRYSKQISFNTYDDITPNDLKAVSIDSITQVKREDTTYAAIAKSTFSRIGTQWTITEYGHCWAEHKEPTLDDYKTAVRESLTTGQPIRSVLTNLERGKSYYVRAYAIATTTNPDNIRTNTLTLYGLYNSEKPTFQTGN
jgi:hypothetical protein